MDKTGELKRILEECGRVAVAFSGGVDSTFLLCFAKETLGSENVIAVTAVAPNFAPDEIDYARKTAKRLGVEHLCAEVQLPELFRKNPPDRCYYCKKAVFTQLMERAESAAANGKENMGKTYAGDCGGEDSSGCKYKTVRQEKMENMEAARAVGGGFVFCDGSNLDDISDYRPGGRAAAELGVRSPLREAQLTKREIREELEKMGVDIWDKPAFACLASRIPYGTEIKDEMLAAVYEIEKMLKDKGYTQVRARLHDEVVRLELLPAEMQQLAADRDLCEVLSARARALGFAYTALDICGYRMGSLNSVL